MFQELIYTLISVIVVSLISLVGVFAIFYNPKKLEKMLLLLVSLSAGTLFGDAFLHLLPETVEDQGFTMSISLLVLAGVLVFFLIEKLVHWHHCHHLASCAEVHPHLHNDKHDHSYLAPLNLIGDGLHNFLDGLVIAASYMISPAVGIATTIAVIMHEIPQEIGDFRVLIYSGVSRNKALLLNLLSGTTAIAGAIIGLMIGEKSIAFNNFIIPFAAGGFVYIAGSNLIPELHKGCNIKGSGWHFILMLLGIFMMLLLKIFGT